LILWNYYLALANHTAKYFESVVGRIRGDIEFDICLFVVLFYSMEFI